MIETEHQLAQTRQGIQDLEDGLAALRRDVLPLSPDRFALMAEPVEDQLRDLRQQVEAYLARTTFPTPSGSGVLHALEEETQ